MLSLKQHALIVLTAISATRGYAHDCPTFNDIYSCPESTANGVPAGMRMEVSSDINTTTGVATYVFSYYNADGSPLLDEHGYPVPPAVIEASINDDSTMQYQCSNGEISNMSGTMGMGDAGGAYNQWGQGGPGLQCPSVGY